jgi:hypothetical protein
MDDEARRTILARRARFVAAALSGLTISTTAVAQTRVPEEPEGQADPLSKQRALAKCLSWVTELDLGSCKEPVARDAAERQAAKPLFAEARAYSEVGDFDRAARSYEEALELTHDPRVAVELARALERSGKLVQAVVVALRYAGCTASRQLGSEPALNEILERVGPRLARVRFEVVSLTPATEDELASTARLEIEHGGPGGAVQLDKPPATEALCFDPGKLRVRALRRARLTTHVQVELQAGTESVIRLDLDDPGLGPLVCLQPMVCLEPPLPPPTTLAGDGARFALGAEAIATTTGAESAGGEGAATAYVGWGNELHFRVFVLAGAGGTDDGLVFPLGAGVGTRLFYGRQPDIEVGFGLAFSGGYLIVPGSRREIDSGPYIDARFEPTVFRLGDGLGYFSVFVGVRFARRIDETPGFSPVAALLGAAYSFTLEPEPEPTKQAGTYPPSEL